MGEAEQGGSGHDASGGAPAPDATPTGATPTVHREVETKFRVHGLFRLPDLAGPGAVARVEPREARELVAVYHDTADLRLAREGITLRRREGGEDAGWHLKLPAGGTARDEVRLPLEAGEAGAVPRELSDLVFPYLRSAALEPVAVLQTERLPFALLTEDGRELAELTDDTVSVLDGDRVLVRFRELELEEAQAGPGELDAVVAALQEAGALPGEFVSKAVRALGPRATAPGDLPEPAPVDQDDPAGTLVTAYLATHVRALRRADLGVRRGEDDAVHQMRVAARRMRSGLRAFRPLVEREWADGLRDELQWVAGELGGVRDREVLLERLEGALHELPPEADALGTRTLLSQEIGGAHDAARAEALEALRSDRYAALLDALVEAVRAPRLTPLAEEPCRSALPPLMEAAWKRLARDAKQLRLDGEDDEWHETRKAAKLVRYTAEAIAPALGKPAKRLAKQVTRVTELLGDHQDAAIAAETLHGIAAGEHVSGRQGFTLGLLFADQRNAVLVARVRFLELWPEVSHRRHRDWLR
ncbi:CHAD domain-containing protein [Motilibacter rhizosphaerae]|uniref:CHAD domain-containing protein n=1 Tax=Motilibacter rhizosphaerae TaxID=598652 RepID=A0A4Q7NUD4_9ACTN|nr:CYTH and CHAD domain-containing protein [Motilibacter rhizosphaerae]RZS90793.1 CHAD domain-containing protein [Motilibacter rhizosphaerae]